MVKKSNGMLNVGYQISVILKREVSFYVFFNIRQFVNFCRVMRNFLGLFFCPIKIKFLNKDVSSVENTQQAI